MDDLAVNEPLQLVLLPISGVNMPVGREVDGAGPLGQPSPSYLVKSTAPLSACRCRARCCPVGSTSSRMSTSYDHEPSDGSRQNDGLGRGSSRCSRCPARADRAGRRGRGVGSPRGHPWASRRPRRRWCRRAARPSPAPGRPTTPSARPRPRGGRAPRAVRVLPTPPGPVSVTSGRAASSAPTCSSSPVRPTRGDGGRGSDDPLAGLGAAAGSSARRESR